jgi:hypothetical protein
MWYLRADLGLLLAAATLRGAGVQDLPLGVRAEVERCGDLYEARIIRIDERGSISGLDCRAWLLGATIEIAPGAVWGVDGITLETVASERKPIRWAPIALKGN